VKAVLGRGTRRFVILTGLSGSGKTHAIRALEDLGYFCIDNLPTQLIPTIAELASREATSLEKVAIVVDVREKGFLANFPRVFRKLRTAPKLKPTLIFLEASHSALVRRFSETRRPHPLGTGQSVAASVRSERERMEPIRRLADPIINTDKFNVHELRETIHRTFGGRKGAPEILVQLTSFGYRHGVPADSDLVFDVRFLPNPNYIPAFKKLTGKNPSVARYIRSFPQTQEFIERISDLLVYLLPHYIAEGKSYLTISFGCTGGHHRSVMIANELRKRLSEAGYRVKETHRDITK